MVGEGIGTMYSPWGTVRQAKADAKAKIIIAKTENDIADLNIRAKSRLEYQESVRQRNIEQITVHAAKALPPQVSDKDVDKDWIFQFFDCAQEVCDEDMQILWRRILAGETSQPDSFSMRTLHFLKTLSKLEAENFTEYCRFVFSFDDGWPFVILSDACKKQMSYIFGGLDMTSQFVSIGLVFPSDLFLSYGTAEGKKIHYFNKSYVLYRAAGAFLVSGFGPKIHNLSQIGIQLQSIAGANPIENFVKRTSDEIKKHGGLELKLVEDSRNNSKEETA